MSFLKKHNISTVSAVFNPHTTKLLSKTQPETECKGTEMRDQNISNLRQEEKTLFYQLNQKQQKSRQKHLEWAFRVGRQHLELKCKTLELTMRIFDYYCFLKIHSHQLEHSNQMKKKGSSPLDNKDEANLALIACLFTCSKYNEVYPPCVNDFSYISNDKFSKQEIIKKELDILLLTQFAFTISTVSGWYEHLYDDIMPQWAYQCYFKACIMRTEDLARTINQITKNLKIQEVKPSDNVRKVLQKLNVFQNKRDDKGKTSKTSDRSQK